MQPPSAGPDAEPPTPAETLGGPDPSGADDTARTVAALHGDGEPDEIAMWTVMERRRRRREQARVTPAR